VSLAIQTLCRAMSATLSSERAEDLLACGGQLLDVRPPADFRRHRLPGALNIPVESLCYEHRRLNSRCPVIVYGTCEVRSARAARLLACKGFSRIYHLAASE